MPDWEVQDLKEHLGRLTITERWHSPRDIGRILYCTNAEREAWALWQILPCDMTDEELAAFRIDKRRKQLEKRRRDKGIRTKADYLAELASRPKPWEAEGIHRRTWERRRRKAARSDSSPPQGVTPIIVFKEATQTAALVQTESQKKGLQGSGGAERPFETAESEQVESLKPAGPHELESQAAALPADDERLIAFSNWVENAEQKKSTLSSKLKKPWTKPMFSEELRDFAEFPLEANELAIKEASWQRDYFPAARLGPRGRWWYGGRGFKTKDALQASLSPADRKCIALHVGKSGHINSPGSLFIEGTMNAESLFASEEEAKRQTLVRL